MAPPAGNSCSSATSSSKGLLGCGPAGFHRGGFGLALGRLRPGDFAHTLNVAHLHYWVERRGVLGKGRIGWCQLSTKSARICPPFSWASSRITDRNS